MGNGDRGTEWIYSSGPVDTWLRCLSALTWTKRRHEPVGTGVSQRNSRLQT